MKKQQAKLNLYIELFEHKFKARYNRAKAKQVARKINNLEGFDHSEIENYATAEPIHRNLDYNYQ